MPVRARSLRVLIISESCNPEWVSLPLWGWSLPKHVSNIVNVHLVTHVRNRGAIQRAGLAEGLDFTAINNEYVAKPLHRLGEMVRGGRGKGWTSIAALSSLSYYAFEHEVWKLFQDRLRGGEFDLVHRMTPKSPTTPSIIAKRLAGINVPFILGPMAGGIPWPIGFRERWHSEREWMTYVRGAYKLMPGYRSTLNNSSAIIAGSRYNYDQLRPRVGNRVVYMPHNGFEPDRFRLARSRTAEYPIRAAFVGRLVPYKGLDILIKAVADYVKSGKLALEVVGDGPERQGLKQLVASLDLERGVKFHGWLDHTAVGPVLRECDVFAFPSIREAGGSVVIEAMASGLVPVVADYGGPPEFITSESGIAVPFTSEASLASGMRHAIGELIAHPDRIDRMGNSARRAAFEKHAWEVRAKQVVEIYRAVLAGTRDLSPLEFSMEQSVLS